MTSEQHPRTGSRLTLVLTNIGKLFGLLIGLHEAFGQARPAVLLYAFAIWAGVQAVEDLALKVFERAFGGQE